MTRRDICTQLLSKYDQETLEHSIRVAVGCERFAKELTNRGVGVSTDFLTYKMHDVGKLMIVREVLWQSRPLSEQQFSMIKKHAIEGFLLLNKSFKTIQDPLAIDSLLVALFHHENFDGTGYPTGISGDKIPIEARVCRIVDSYDAMTSKRCYKQAVPYNSVMRELKEYSGSHYDPALVPIFEELIEECRGKLLWL